MNKNTLRRTFITIVVLIFVALGAISCTNNDNYTLLSKTGCCAIKVEKIESDVYKVQWIDNTQLDGRYTVFAHVEYPDADLTPEENLQAELDWTISEMMDTCFTHHNHN